MNDSRTPSRSRRHIRWVLVALVLLLGLVMLISAAHGAVSINVPGILWEDLTGSSTVAAEPWQRIILWQVRLPRVLLGVLVGGGLALAGAVMQGVFRNPMADPGVLGVSGGAALGAVLAIHTRLAFLQVLFLPLCSFALACGCAFLVYVVSAARGRTSVVTLLLAGIAVGGIASALTSLVLSLAVSDWFLGQEIVHWLMGGLDGRTWTHVALAAPLVLGGCLLLLLFARDLDVLAGGEDAALSLGVDVPRVRVLLLTLATAVTAAAVSVSGTLVFVGLLVPHILRLLVGPAHLILMVASFLGGAVLLVAADLLARTLIAPEELRLGVLTSLLGGPFFLYLLVAHKLRVEGV
jgi:iron complex transport system permease protein